MKIELAIEGKELENLLNGFHDSYYDLTGESIDSSKAFTLVKMLPVEILACALQWGAGDTVVRDDIYKWIEERVKNKVDLKSL